MYFLINKLNILISFNNTTFKKIIINFLNNSNSLFYFYKKNDFLWQEGLLIDFLQKKSFNNWTKNFLIYSSYLFNEKLMFDKILRFVLIYLVNPLKKNFIFENTSISNFFSFLIFYYFLLFFLLFLIIFIII